VAGANFQLRQGKARNYKRRAGIVLTEEARPKGHGEVEERTAPLTDACTDLLNCGDLAANKKISTKMG